MQPSGLALRCGTLLFLALASGCASAPAAFKLAGATKPPSDLAHIPATKPIRQASHQQPATQNPNERVTRTEERATLLPPQATASVPVGSAGSPCIPLDHELSEQTLVEQVLARNPTLAQMVAAYEAASARPAQVSSLDDPMFGSTIAPVGIGTIQDLNRGYRLEMSQKLPYCGKLALRGENASAEAHAAGNEVEDTRLQLIESARSAFYDYYMVERGLEVNQEGLRLLRDFRQNAKTRYRTGLVPQQDILQADVEIGQQRERRLTLERAREVAIARINTLMHLPPDALLPPPPKTITLGESLPPTPALRDLALSHRPDLKAIADRIKAEETAVALAKKEFAPDFEVWGAYDTFWQEKQLRPQIGLRFNLPVRQSRRFAALAEAEARLAQRQAELARQSDQVNLQVQEAAAQVRESERAVRLYETEILKAAGENVQAAQIAYVTGKIAFLALVEAQRNAVNLRDRYYDAIAAYGRRLATLERVVGGCIAMQPSDSVGSVVRK